MKVSKRDGRAVALFAVVLAAVGAFCLGVGLWPSGHLNSQIDNFLITGGTIDLVLAGIAGLAVWHREDPDEGPVGAMPVEA